MKAYSIYGSPGTGKSTEILNRVKEKISSGLQANKLGLVSFTRAASKELADRAGIFDNENISTIHSMAYRMAGISKNSVVNWRVYKEFGKKIGIDIVGSNPEESDTMEIGDEYLALYSLAKAKMQSYYDTYATSARAGTMAEFLYFCEGYDKYKKDIGYVDFNDMLIKALTAPAPAVDVLFVDEAQDLSPLQWKLIYHWAETIPEIHIAGDDDQAIYVWGGADPHGMVAFEEKFGASRLILDQSHRIPKLVHQLAEELIRRVQSRVDKIYKSRDVQGSVEFFGNVHHLKMDENEDTLVLYRNHSIRKEIEEMLIQNSIPYVVDTGKPGLIGSPKAKAIEAFNEIKKDKGINLLQLPLTKLNALQKHLTNYAKTFLEKNDAQKLQSFEWWEAVWMNPVEERYFKTMYEKFGSLDIQPSIHLTTIHGAKGREADRVILLNGMGGLTTKHFATDPCSEYRTFYVGVTRAKEKLDIVDTDNGMQIDFARVQ